MYVLRTKRKHVPILESTDPEKIIEVYEIREDKYGKGKFEIYDCLKEKVVDVESFKTRHRDEPDSTVRESVSEDSDLSLYAAIGDKSEPSTDSSD